MTLSSLRVHQHTHTGLKAFACSLCPAKLSTRGSLRRHMQLVHPGAAITSHIDPGSCGTCGPCTEVAMGSIGVIGGNMGPMGGNMGAMGANMGSLGPLGGIGGLGPISGLGAMGGDMTSVQVPIRPFVCPLSHCAKSFKTYSDCKRHCKRHILKQQTPATLTVLQYTFPYAYS